jgi:hypothetical protein
MAWIPCSSSDSSTHVLLSSSLTILIFFVQHLFNITYSPSSLSISLRFTHIHLQLGSREVAHHVFLIVFFFPPPSSSPACQHIVNHSIHQNPSPNHTYQIQKSCAYSLLAMQIYQHELLPPKWDVVRAQSPEF